VDQGEALAISMADLAAEFEHPVEGVDGLVVAPQAEKGLAEVAQGNAFDVLVSLSPEDDAQGLAGVAECFVVSA
jgi:hypothetical protein